MNLSRIFVFTLSGAIVLFVGSGLPAECGNPVSTKIMQLKFVEDLIISKPTDPGLRVQHAELLCCLNRFDEAIDESDVVIHMSPKIRDAYVVKARALAGKGRFKEAVRCLDEAFKLGVPSPKLLLAKGTYLKRDERYAEAVVILSQVIKAEPRYAEAYMQRAYCYREIYGPTEKSLKDLEMVAKLKPAYPTVKAQIKGLRNAISKQNDNRKQHEISKPAENLRKPI
jgi:tetratricopeptide (TPR) repeat protein